MPISSQNLAAIQDTAISSDAKAVGIDHSRPYSITNVQYPERKSFQYYRNDAFNSQNAAGDGADCGSCFRQ